MTRFSKLEMRDGKLVETNVREIKQSDIQRCPHFIMVAEHYRADGSCRCNDREHTEMKEWGYKWRNGAWQ
jgi:hypothetical protein